MAKNVKYEPGWRKAYACTKPDEPDSGDPVRIGNMTGIALLDEDAAGKTVVDKGPFSAKFTVKDNGGTGIGVGDTIWYHDDQTPPLDNVPTGGYFYGYAEEAVAKGQTAIIEVSHGCAPGGAGTIGNGTVGATQLASNAVTTDKILNANVTAAKLSAAANSRAIIVPLGAVSATTSQVAFVAPTAGSLNAAKIVTKDAVAANDTKLDVRPGRQGGHRRGHRQDRGEDHQGDRGRCTRGVQGAGSRHPQCDAQSARGWRRRALHRDQIWRGHGTR